LEITHLWYAGAGTRPEDVHLVTDSDEMLFLSLAPLRKDIQLYIQNHEIDSVDMALSSLHPLNDTPLNSHFASRSVRLHYGPMTRRLWRNTEVKAEIAGKKAVVAREAIQVWNALKAAGGCGVACKLLGAALHSSPMARRWPFDQPLEIIVPTDRAFRGRPPFELLAEQNGSRLYQFILEHVVPVSGRRSGGTALSAEALLTRSEIPVARTIEVGRHKLMLIDKNLILNSLRRGQ
jgi:hypothetical protein